VAHVLTKSIHVHLSAALFNQIDVLGNWFLIFWWSSSRKLCGCTMCPFIKPRGVELVLPVGDPGQSGRPLIRSAEAFGIPAVYFWTQEAAHPFLAQGGFFAKGKLRAGSVFARALGRAGPSFARIFSGYLHRAWIWTGRRSTNSNGRKMDCWWLVRKGGRLCRQGASVKFKKEDMYSNRKKVQSLNVVVAASVAMAIQNSKTIVKLMIYN